MTSNSVNKSKASPTVSFTFRLTNGDRAWIQDFAQRHGVDMAHCVRWALEALRQYSQGPGGLRLPIDLERFAQDIEATRPASALKPSRLTTLK
jgi:hypothetical protein